MSNEMIASVLSSLGVGGILAWYLWYSTTVQFPKMYEAFREDLAQERNQRNGLYRTLRDLVDELRHRPCIMEKHEEEPPQDETK